MNNTSSSSNNLSLETSNEYVKRIRKKIEEEKLARKDREQRRRKILLEQQHLFHDIEERRRKEIMLEKLLKKSVEEIKLRDKLMEEAKWKEIIKENRTLRERQYQEQREKDKENSQLIDKQQIERERLERKRKRELLMQYFKEREREKEAKKAQKKYDFFSIIAGELVNLALKEIEYLEKTEGLRPSKDISNEWKAMFVRGEHFYVELTDNTNKYLSNMLEKIEDVLNPPPPEVKKPKYEPKLPINSVIIGNPLSGKTCISKGLASSFRICRICPEEILKSAVSNINNVGTEIEECTSEYDKHLDSAIKSAIPFLLKGVEVPPNILVSIVLNEIQRIESNVEQYYGWIIDGFPNSIEAVIELEKVLSGYDPDVKYERKQSHLVAINDLQRPRYPFKGLTSVIFLEISGEEVFERASNLEGNSENNTAQLAVHLMQYKKSREQLLDWYAQFNNVRQVQIRKGENVSTLVDKIWKILDNDRRWLENDESERKKEKNSSITCAIPTSASVEAPNSSTQIDYEFAKNFDNEWYKMEDVYMEGLKTVLNNLKEEREIFVSKCFSVKEEFIDYLKEPDDKQKLVSEFQTQYNHFAKDLRSSIHVKREQHKRAQDLKEKLWEIFNTKKEDAKARLESIKEQAWISEHKMIITRQYMKLLQFEANKFVQQSKFIVDYYYKTYNRPPVEVPLEEILVDILNVPQDLKQTKKPPSRKTNKPPSRKTTKPGSRTTSKEDDATFEPDDSMDSVYERAKGIISSTHTLLMQEPETKDSKKDKKKPSSSKKKQKESNIIQPTVIEDMEKALETESKLYLERIEKVYNCCDNTLNKETEEHLQHLLNVIEEWIEKRYENEMENTYNLLCLIQDSIEQEADLVSDLFPVSS